MKYALIVALMALGAVPAHAQKVKPSTPSETPKLPVMDSDQQIKMLKELRDWTQLKAQSDPLVAKENSLQLDILKDCVDAVTAAKLDSDKYTCDFNSLAFIPKPEPPKAIAPPAPAVARPAPGDKQ